MLSPELGGGLGCEVPGLSSNEPGDSRNRPKVVDLEVLQGHLNPEPLFQLSQEFHEGERVHQAGFDQVRFHGRDLNVQLLREQRGKQTL